MRIQGKVFVLTGAGSGIGRELCLALLAGGARVAAVDLNTATLEETAQLAKAGNRLSLHTLNVADREAVEALPLAVLTAHGQIDGLINNAGIIQPFVKLEVLEYSAIERVMQVNFYGSLYFCKSFLPHLLERPEAHIANVASMGGFLPVPGQSIYGAAKAAVKLFTEALYAELKDTKVGVSIVFPGAVATNITDNSGVSVPGADKKSDKAKSYKALPADEAAKIIIRGIEQKQFRILVGSDARFMDIIYRLHPRKATEFIAKKMADLLG